MELKISQRSNFRWVTEKLDGGRCGDKFDRWPRGRSGMLRRQHNFRDLLESQEADAEPDREWKSLAVRAVDRGRDEGPTVML